MAISFSPQFLANLEQGLQSATNAVKTSATNLGATYGTIANKAITALRGSSLNPFSPAGQRQGAELSDFIAHPTVEANQTPLTPAQHKTRGDILMTVGGVTGGTEAVDSLGKQAAEALAPARSANDVVPPPLPQPAGVAAPAPAPAITPQPATPSPGLFSRAYGKFRSAVDPLVTESSKALAQMGPTGQQLASTIRDTYAAADVQAGQVYTDLIKPLKALSPSAQANFKAVAEGQAQPISDKVTQLMQIFDKYRQDVAKKSEDLGLFAHKNTADPNQLGLFDALGLFRNRFGARQNYFPQVLDPQYVNDVKNAPAIIDHLVSTGQAHSSEEAQTILKQVQDQANGTSPATYSMNGGSITRQFGNIEQSRGNLQLPPEAYKQDPINVLTGYFQHAYKRINEAQNFGVNGEKLPDAFNAIGAEGGNGGRAQQIMEQVLGTQPQGLIPKDINLGARNFESAFKLGTAWVNHAGQITNPITSKGLWNTLLAVGQYVTSPDSAIETALRSGSLNRQSLEAATGDQYSSWVSKLPWMKSLGNVMTFNRIIDANASQFALKSMVDRLVANPQSSLARRILTTQYGVNPETVIAQGGLQGEDFLKAINEGVNRDIAQFRPQDLPQIYSNPDFKLATQFKQFAFKQAQFVMDNVVKEAAHGNVTPLLRYITAGTVLGEGVADTKYGLKNAVGTVTGAPVKPRPQGIARVVDNITSVGGAGLLNEAYQQLSNGGLNAYEWIFGPTVSDAVKLGSNLVNATKGKPAGLERQAVQQVPVVGNQAAQEYVPSAPPGRTANPNTSRASGSGSIPDPQSQAYWIK